MQCVLWLRRVNSKPSMAMNKYEKWLLKMIEQELPRSATKSEIIEWLAEKGITDNTNCRRVVLSDFVAKEYNGNRRLSKGDAMYRAADYFGASYEMVRNNIYYKSSGSEQTRKTNQKQ